MRDHFEVAKLDRARLSEQSATTMNVNFRSWRDTGITWLALQGVDVAKMQRRAGHDSISTTLGYAKMAEDLTGSIGEPFPPLPAELLEAATAKPASPRSGPRGDRAKVRAKSPRRLKKPEKLVGEAGFARTLFWGGVSRAIRENLGELEGPRNAVQREGTRDDGAGGNWEATRTGRPRSIDSS